MAIMFDGRVAIVTGAGGGIGRTHALELARRGCAVVVNDLGGDVAGRGGSASMAEAVVEEIRAAGGKAVASHASVADSESARQIVATALETFGRVDILINNAGIMRNALLPDMTDEDWNALIATHLTGSFNMTRAVWPHMKEQGYGRIVFTSSSSGMFGIELQTGYGAAKAGIFGLMNVAATEGAPHGILCNAIMPNAQSRMADQMLRDSGGDMGPEADAVMALVGNSFDPEYNAPLAVYLASEDCTSTHAIYSQCLGRVARVFVGVTPGWQAQRQTPPSVEDIAAHWDQITDASRGYVAPTSPGDELGLVISQGGARA
jgi:NAD(P)-dependent dehydrogenase (short-subunit alcohol dehydrogenase family)